MSTLAAYVIGMTVSEAAWLTPSAFTGESARKRVRTHLGGRDIPAGMR